MIQLNNRNAIASGVADHGLAPGAAAMMTAESAAADQAIQTGLYVTWRSSNGKDCTRVGPKSKCFCDHPYSQHSFVSKKAVYPRCMSCPCSAFAFMPSRPEEIGEWWLPRRKGFNVHAWRAQCKVGLMKSPFIRAVGGQAQTNTFHQTSRYTVTSRSPLSSPPPTPLLTNSASMATTTTTPSAVAATAAARASRPPFSASSATSTGRSTRRCLRAPQSASAPTGQSVSSAPPRSSCAAPPFFGCYMGI